MTNIATNIIKQKVKYSILILYFFVVSCATGSQMVRDNRIYIGMSKQELLSLYYGAAFLVSVKILFYTVRIENTSLQKIKKY